MKRCAVCWVHSSNALCEACFSLIQAPVNPCQYCAKPLNQAGGVCGECRSDRPAFNHTYCAALYQSPVSLWVQQLKFGERLDRARIMAEAMAQTIHQVPKHIPIIPVPLHPNRLLVRGYNQASELAKIIAQKQHRKVLDNVLIRTKNTAMQAELHEKQRADNVRAAFSTSQAVQYEKVLLLDDVMTTGQTLRSAAKCLINSGVQSVDVVVFARSYGH